MGREEDGCNALLYCYGEELKSFQFFPHDAILTPKRYHTTPYHLNDAGHLHRIDKLKALPEIYLSVLGKVVSALQTKSKVR